MAEFLHQYKVSLTNVFMLVIRTKYQYQYLYIQKITHVLSNIHRKKHFHVSNTHITKKQYTHKHRNMHCHHHQNQERALASRLPSPLKPNTKTSIYRRLTFHEWVRAREWENENDNSRVIARTWPQVWEGNDSENENGVVAPLQRVCDNEIEKDSARGKWESENKSTKDEWKVSLL